MPTEDNDPPPTVCGPNPEEGDDPSPGLDETVIKKEVRTPEVVKKKTGEQPCREPTVSTVKDPDNDTITSVVPLCPDVVEETWTS